MWGPLWQGMVPAEVGRAGQGRSSEQNITVKELLPIVIAAAIWGQTWGGKTVRAQCANMAAVAVVELWYKHGARDDASEMLPGISGGQAHIPCFLQPPQGIRKTLSQMPCQELIWHCFIPSIPRQTRSQWQSWNRC